VPLTNGKTVRAHLSPKQTIPRKLVDLTSEQFLNLNLKNVVMIRTNLLIKSLTSSLYYADSTLSFFSQIVLKRIYLVKKCIRFYDAFQVRLTR